MRRSGSGDEILRKMGLRQAEAFKRSQLEEVARHRDALRETPSLRWLFFEITDRCNLSCAHCGSRCTASGTELSPDDVGGVLDTICGKKPQVCLTGGEPLLHPNFFDIADRVRSSGFLWGMTTNGTLIDDAAASRLRETGMSTVSVSLDGLEASHDALRRREGAWKLAVRGLECLMRAGFDPQVTTVVHKGNINELDALYDILCGMGIKKWRPINVEPIGRACESDGMLLGPGEFSCLIDYIKEKRFDPECRMEVTYGCSHYLGTLNERMVRDHYFLCGAGILTAGIRANGDICACLDIEDRPELVQGNIRKDSFWDVWTGRYGVFRQDRTADSEKCSACPERYLCGGDSAHTWDFGRGEPLLCACEYLKKHAK